MAQTPAELKKCQALFLGPFIKYGNNATKRHVAQCGVIDKAVVKVTVKATRFDGH